MSERKELKKSHAAELSSYLRYKQRIFENTDISDTDSSVSEGEVKRKRTLSYFGGSGIKEWSPKSMFVINDLNVTQLFLKFRSRNIILAEEINCVNSIRILSLSHIFTVDKFDDKYCISYYCSALKNDLHKYAYENIHMNKVNIEAIYYCKQLIDAIDENQDIGEIEFNPTNTIDVYVKEIALEYIDVVAGNNVRSESTFIDKHILPFLRKVLLKNSNLIYSM
ncbi:unnamed protein product [Rhizopus stolonifer]